MQSMLTKRGCRRRQRRRESVQLQKESRGTTCSCRLSVHGNCKPGHRETHRHRVTHREIQKHRHRGTHRHRVRQWKQN